MPLMATEFTVFWPTLGLNKAYVVWFIGNLTKSGDMTQHGLLECSYKFKSLQPVLNIRILHVMLRTARASDSAPKIYVIRELVLFLIFF